MALLAEESPAFGGDGSVFHEDEPMWCCCGWSHGDLSGTQTALGDRECLFRPGTRLIQGFAPPLPLLKYSSAVWHLSPV